MSCQNPILLVGEAVACRRPGALVNKLESGWLEGVWLGRDNKTDEHMIGTPNGMVRSRALKRRVERRRWDTTLLNAMGWDLWKPTPVTRGRPLKVRSDREPILMDTATTATAAAPSQDTTGAKNENNSLSSSDGHSLDDLSDHNNMASALDERVGNETGEDSQPVHRIPKLMAKCEDTITSDAIAEARRIQLEKLTKVKDAVIKVAHRTDATTRHLTGRWVDTMHNDGARRARWATRGYEQTLNGNWDFFSSTPAMMHLTMMLVEAALKGRDCSGAFYQSPLNSDGTESQVWIEPPPEAELGPDYMWEAVSTIPGLKGAPRAWDTHCANVLKSSIE